MVVSHSDHVLSPNGAPGLVWKRTKKPPCQQELSPIDLVCCEMLVFSQVQTNPTKGETAPGFKVTGLKKLGVGF